jgi:DNA-binding LacI/PurR family transcriptional regulator
MSEAALLRGYAFVFVPPGPSEGYLRTLVDQRGIDGAILLDPQAGDAFPRALMDAGMPFATLGRVPERPDSPRVEHDYAGALAAIAAHLAERGYGRTGLVNLPGHLTTLVDIEDGFRSAFDGSLISATADHTDRAAEEAALALLRRPDRPDAIVCVSERHAAAVFRMATDLGLSIPDDVGVVALGSAFAPAMVPTLTSVELSPDRAGRELVRLLEHLLDGDEVPARTVVPFVLQPRESTRRTG